MSDICATVISGNYGIITVVLINTNTSLSSVLLLIKPWNNLKTTFDDWSSVAKFGSLIKKTDLSDFLCVLMLRSFGVVNSCLPEVNYSYSRVITGGA